MTALGEEGKSMRGDVECIVADAGARSHKVRWQELAISSWTVLQFLQLSSIPYIGWLAAGWANLIGQRAGEAAGSQVNSMISDC